MLSRFGQLVAVLEEKLRLLRELVSFQSALREYLIDPDWRELGRYTKPQEPIVARIRELQAEQERQMAQLAALQGTDAPRTLRGLAERLEAHEGRTLQALIERIAAVTAELQGVSQLTGMLNQAQAQFLHKWQGELRPGESAHTLYSPRGYGGYGGGYARMSREA